jgi:hypothetical protein
MIVLANDTFVFGRAASFGGEISSGILNFDGSSAVRRIVSVTSSPVDTRPATLIGPIANVDIFTCVVAVAVNFPPATLASTSQRTGAGVFFTVSWLRIVKWY